EKSADNLLREIETSLRRPLSRLLFALGIRLVGERAAKNLARRAGTAAALAAMSEEELEKIPEVGPKIAASVRVFFSQPRNIELLERLEKAGVNLTEPGAAAAGEGRAARAERSEDSGGAGGVAGGAGGASGVPGELAGVAAAAVAGKNFVLT